MPSDIQSELLQIVVQVNIIDGNVLTQVFFCRELMVNGKVQLWTPIPLQVVSRLTS